MQGGRPALSVAAEYGHLSIVKLLLAPGSSHADVAAKCEVGATALHYAAGCGHAAVVKFLLEHGAKANVATAFDVRAPAWALHKCGARADRLRVLGSPETRDSRLRFTGQPVPTTRP